MAKEQISYRTFRINTTSDYIPVVEKLLLSQGFTFKEDPFLYCTRQLIKEPFPLGRSLAAFWGLIYIQDRASILSATALNPKKGALVLDMCASPGSKTSLLAQLVGPQGLVVGNEPTKSRLITLQRNLAKLNLLNTVTCSWPAEELPENIFKWDYILLDPPCSGWGTNHPQAKKIWHGDRIKPLIALQQKLLTKASQLLMPGGSLIYSTCTTNIHENEEQVSFAIRSLGLGVHPLDSYGFSCTPPLLPECAGTLSIPPSKDSQGFYIAHLQKPHSIEHTPPTAEPLWPQNVTVLPASTLSSFGFDTKKLPPGEIHLSKDSVYFVPSKALSLPQSLHFQGVSIGKTSGQTFIPSPRLHFFSKEHESLPHLHIENTKTLENLIQGQSIPTSLKGKNAALFWNNLALGCVRLKSGRALWSEK